MPRQSSNVVPLNTRQARIERQIDLILTDLETLPIPIKERTAALYTIMRIQVATNALAKGSRNDNAGSAVKRYAQAFAHDARSRKAHPRPTVIDAPDGLGDDDDDPAA